jgi:hypothetical protein
MGEILVFVSSVIALKIQKQEKESEEKFPPS